MKESPLLKESGIYGPDLNEVRYKCNQCQAEDVDRGVGGVAPVALQCWNCKSGQNRSLQEMMAERTGMFPLGVAETPN